MEIISRKVTADFLAPKAADESGRAVFKNKAEVIFTQTNTAVFAGAFQPFEIGNLLKCSRGFDLFDDFLDATQQRGIVKADKSELKDSRKAVFTRRGRDVEKFCSG